MKSEKDNGARAKSLSAVLSALRPTAGAPLEAYGPAFARMADVLTHDVVLIAGGRAHRLMEIEFYFRGGNHVDVFAHGDSSQYRTGYWYFHKTHGVYRGGTYKGVDLTFGTRESPAGILLRGIESLDAPRVRTDGPSLTVDHLLRATGERSVAALASRWDLRAESDGGDGSAVPLALALRPRAGPRIAPLATPRVGLALRADRLEERARFVARPYRFVAEPRMTRKGRAHMVVALHARGEDVAAISAFTGIARSIVVRFVRAFDAGRGESPAKSVGAPPSGEALCRMLGACWVE